MTETRAPKKPVLFYALASEGMGHATRSRPVIERLKDRYDVHIFCGGRVADYMRKHFHNGDGTFVHTLFHINLIYRKQELQIGETVRKYLPSLPIVIGHAARLAYLMLKMKPVAVISDYEFLASWMGGLTRTPVIVCDNVHLVSHGALGELANVSAEAVRHTQIATAWNTPFYKRMLITSFYQPGLKAGVDQDKHRFVKCAVRDDVAARKAAVRTDGPVLVYQTTTTNEDLPGTLEQAAQRTGLSFAVYGAGDRANRPGVEFRAFSEHGFLDTLAAAPFVIVNGGHSTIVEALSLGKAVLAEPVRNQVEQAYNADAVTKMGVGLGTDKLSVENIVDVANRAEMMRARASRLDVVDTDGLVTELEEAIHAVAKGSDRELPPVRNAPRTDSNVLPMRRMASSR